MVMHHVPVERCADIIESMSGARPSAGWVHGLLAPAAEAVAPAGKAIRALIILARVIYGGETPTRHLRRLQEPANRSPPDVSLCIGVPSPGPAAAPTEDREFCWSVSRCDAWRPCLQAGGRPGDRAQRQGLA